MADSRKGGLQDVSSGGIAGNHADAPLTQLLVGPATENQFNTIHMPLAVVACWAVDDIRFAFDSSFIDAACSGTGNTTADTDAPQDSSANAGEDIRVEMKQLKRLAEANPGCPLSLFGHADPVGSDVYNKGLSERRARAVYAMLIFKSDPDTALDYWQHIASAENWGTDQKQRMQDLVGTSEQMPSRELMRAYLQVLSDPGPTLTKTDFLAQGAGPDRKGDFQGCSEFNPLLIFSQEKQDTFDKAKQSNDAGGIAYRNDQNAPNRRVLGLLFRKGTKIDPAKWPCPRAAEGIDGCIRRFWSDGDNRRGTHLSQQDRHFRDKRDTFACRFYQRLAGRSPCEVRSRRTFRYTLEIKKELPWKDASTLLISSDDGESTYEFAFGKGKLTADSRFFLLFDVEQGVMYKGEILASKLKLPLFGLSDLYRIADPLDSLKTLTLPDPLPGPDIPDANGNDFSDLDIRNEETGVDEDAVTHAAAPLPDNDATRKEAL